MLGESKNVETPFGVVRACFRVLSNSSNIFIEMVMKVMTNMLILARNPKNTRTKGRNHKKQINKLYLLTGYEIYILVLKTANFLDNYLNYKIRKELDLSKVLPFYTGVQILSVLNCVYQCNQIC